MCETDQSRRMSLNEQVDTDVFVPSLLCYLAMRTKTSSVKGKRIHFQFSLDDVNLYHAKFKGKHPTNIKIPISEGTECHYSRNNSYYLTASHDFTTYRMTFNDVEIYKAEFEKVDNNNDIPKKMRVEWTPNDGTPSLVLISKMPERNDEGKYILDFDGRYAEPSIKNCIFIDPNDGGIRAMVRKVDQWEQDIDAHPSVPSLLLFTILLCLNICTF